MPYVTTTERVGIRRAREEVWAEANAIMEVQKQQVEQRVIETNTLNLLRKAVMSDEDIADVMGITLERVQELKARL